MLVETLYSVPFASLTFNRPEAHNATSIALLDAIDDALDLVEQRDDIDVVILAGAGRSFCAGLDLAEVLADEATIRRLLGRLSHVMRRVRRLPCATIARVQGAAIGGGFGFMAVADFAITHDDAKIGYPPLASNLSPALMAPWLIRKIGPSRARSMLLRGGLISGRQAFDLGLATHLEPRDRLEKATLALARELSLGSRVARVRMKSLLDSLDGSLDDRSLDLAAEVSADVMAHPETRARIERLRRGDEGDGER